MVEEWSACYRSGTEKHGGLQMLHVLPLPDHRFSFRLEDENGDKVICEVSAALAHSDEEREMVALKRHKS